MGHRGKVYLSAEFALEAQARVYTYFEQSHQHKLLLQFFSSGDVMQYDAI